MNKFFTVIMMVATLALAIPAGAQGCVPTTSEPEFDTGADLFAATGGDGAGVRLYWDHDCPNADDQVCLSTWVYQESNFIPGLQRQDTVKDDTCGGAIAGDTVIF